MAQSKDAVKFRGTVSVSLKPVNSYGDILPGEAEVSYTFETDQPLGSLIMALEDVKNGKKIERAA